MKPLIAAIGGGALAALAATTVLFVYNVAAYDGQSVDFLAAIGGFLLLAALANIIVACTLGLLWHWFVQTRSWTSVHVYWPTAALVGALPPILIMAPAYLAGDFDSGIAIVGWLSSFFMMVGLGAALGGLTGLFAWLIRRPDRDAMNAPGGR